jgi:poly(A) polymerase
MVRVPSVVRSASLQVTSRAGTVESRIRQLVMKLEYVDSLILAHPFIKGFDQVSHCVSEEEVRQVAQGQISDIITKRTKADIEGLDGSSTVHSTTFYIGLLIEPKPRASSVPAWFPCGMSAAHRILCFQVGAVGPRRLDISYPTTEFTKLVKMWEKYDEDTMGIVVRNIKRSCHSMRQVIPSDLTHFTSSALPDYVFDEGERQPKQALKRPKTGKVGCLGSFLEHD